MCFRMLGSTPGLCLQHTISSPSTCGNQNCLQTSPWGTERPRGKPRPSTKLLRLYHQLGARTQTLRETPTCHSFKDNGAITSPRGCGRFIYLSQLGKAPWGGDTYADPGERAGASQGGGHSRPQALAATCLGGISPSPFPNLCALKRS